MVFLQNQFKVQSPCKELLKWHLLLLPHWTPRIYDYANIVHFKSLTTGHKMSLISLQSPLWSCSLLRVYSHLAPFAPVVSKPGVFHTSVQFIWAHVNTAISHCGAKQVGRDPPQRTVSARLHSNSGAVCLQSEQNQVFHLKQLTHALIYDW